MIHKFFRVIIGKNFSKFKEFSLFILPDRGGVHGVVCIFLFCSCFLYGENAPMIDFFQLEATTHEESFVEQRIRIRGFLYQQESSLILAGEPNLKTCCVGSAAKRHAQILVFGDIEKALEHMTPVIVEGHLTFDPHSLFPYRLEQAALVPQESYPYGPIALASVLLAATSILWMRRVK